MFYSIKHEKNSYCACSLNSGGCIFATSEGKQLAGGLLSASDKGKVHGTCGVVM